MLDPFVIEPTATYANLLFVLQKANRARERFIIYNTTNQLSSNISAGEDAVNLKFNKETVDLAATQYKCARFGDQCASNFKQFVTDIKSIGTENIQAAKTAGKDVVDAWKKLSAALKNVSKQTQKYLDKKIKKPVTQEEKDAALSRQDQLLRSVYGSDFKRMK